MNIGFTIQVDTLCHKIPNFIEKATAAGVRRVFIGLENINPDNLIAAKKRQNKITEYREMLQKWRDHGAITYAGYILGFPADTKESILRDIEIIKRELPLDILEFFFLTPLPGSEDHKTLLAARASGWTPTSTNTTSTTASRIIRQMSDAGVGGGLSRGLAQLLHARPYPHDPAPRPAPTRSAGPSTTLTHDPVVLPDDPLRGRASARGRRLPPQIPPRPPARPAASKTPSSSIRATGCGNGDERPSAISASSCKTQEHAQGGARRRPTAGPTAISPSRRRGTTSSRRWSSTMRPAAARRRSPANGATI